MNVLHNYSHHFSIDESTFSQIDRWVQEVQSERKGNAVIILVGNKTDLSEKRFKSLIVIT